MDRRVFCASMLSSAVVRPACAAGLDAVEVARIDRGRVVRAADRYLTERPLTITAIPAARSPGGPHGYYSEGDYWWPDPSHADGPLRAAGRLFQSGSFRRPSPGAIDTLQLVEVARAIAVLEPS